MIPFVPSARLLSVPFAALLLASPIHSHAQSNCGAFAGTVSVDVGPICLVQGQAQLIGVPSTDAAVPAGFASTYLLSRTNSLIIEQINPIPSFTVGTVDVWRIHRLVYDPASLDPGSLQPGTSSIYDLQSMISQGGGPACGSLSMTNAAVKTMECEPPCIAFAGGMSIDSTTVCLQNGQAVLTASPTGTAILPQGFEQRFLLTRTNGLIIEQVGSTPSFTVSSVDVWRIHSLVYDPSTLDLGNIQFGATSAYDLQNMLLQGGGSICASLDISGAPVKTGACSNPCTAAAGTTSADNPDQCLENGAAVLHITPDGAAVVPNAFTTVYILSIDDAPMTILAVSADPEFTVNAAGAFVVHAFVYSPATFNLNTIIPGTTTIGELDEQLLQGEGTICAALDLEGAYFQVADCNPMCITDAGTMTAESGEVCFENGSATVAATSDGNSFVPSGFLMGYFLSSGPGRTLVAFSASPVFTVTAPGSFQIHPFVYDPATIAPATLVDGTTSAFDVSDLLIPAGGSLCGSIDLFGAHIYAVICEMPCTAGVDSTVSVCLTDPPFQLFSLLGGNPCPDGTWTTAADPVVNGTFDPATDPAGTYYYTVMTTGGLETSMVTVNVLECPGFGPTTLDPIGGTTDVSTGVVCPPDLSNRSVLGIWPNPAEGTVYITLPFACSSTATVELSDAIGRTHALASTVRRANILTLDASGLAPGLWTLRVTDGNHWATGRFIRAEK